MNAPAIRAPITDCRLKIIPYGPSFFRDKSVPIETKTARPNIMA